MGGGLYTSEWVLLNLVLQAIALQNKKSRKSPQTHVTNLKADALTALDCVQLLEGRGIGDQVNCLADLASWAWDMGLGQPPEWGGGVCLGNAGALKLYAAQTYSKGVQEEGLAG